MVLGLMLLTSVATAQRYTKTDTLVSRGLRVGLDLYGPVYTYLRPEVVYQGEGSLDLWIAKKYYAVLEPGVFRYKYQFSNQLSSFDYLARGYYGRLGVDVNLLQGEDMVYVGARYGRAEYRESFSNIIIDQSGYFGSVQGAPVDRRLVGHWAEIVGGVRVRLKPQVFIGFTGRFKFKIGLNETEDLTTFQIPGYGVSDRPTRLGINYYLLYKFGKAPAPAAPLKFP
ncbi:hypothetical protein SAMN05421823_101195 [Catalinimonas alkaloidigena]|uniref:Outer membrane protein beta-barrel domain-containing protein n=2 Tax=Catalinimonas alkaloidigena TaxID=1075417 RepID=A0A1G8WXB0_9BACT|nr:hypothetical protein SAMN05421823_101195 [Catalinimonas alkaloidigena]